MALVHNSTFCEIMKLGAQIFPSLCDKTNCEIFGISLVVIRAAERQEYILNLIFYTICFHFTRWMI